MLQHEPDKGPCFALEPLRLDPVLGEDIDYVVGRGNPAVIVRLIGVGSDLRRPPLSVVGPGFLECNGHDAHMVPSSRTADDEMKIGTEVEVGFTHGRKAALKTENGNRVLHGNARQGGLDRDDCHRFVTGCMKPPVARNKSPFHRVNRAHHPFGGIGDQGKELCPVAYLIPAKLERPCHEGIDEE
ncbi:MAG: hypothetical protein A4E57_04342 [Syntrophorhabdaceae bacterium PtaU1.Bin034]|nr:MAG: hypothetical protein A4E57_04342 [Syntrophorhabdaceae bacterium PtaU1.Bin034]